MPTNQLSPPPWRSSKAKKLLQEDIVSNVVKPEMDATTVFQMRPEFQLYKFANFKTNLKNLRDAIASGKTAASKPTKWGKSKAKDLLRHDIITGVVKPEMDGATVFLMRPEYQLYKEDNFKSNFKNLREVIDKQYKRMQQDVQFYAHDRGLLLELRKKEPLPGADNQWHQSEARRLLKIDIDNGEHTRKKPSVLYKSREEYQEFPPDVFRKHIHQEVDERSSRLFRFEKKSLRPRGPAPSGPVV